MLVFHAVKAEIEAVLQPFRAGHLALPDQLFHDTQILFKS